MSLRDLSRIQRLWNDEKARLSTTDDTQLVRGKDCLEIGRLALCRFGMETDEFDRVLWATFDRSCLTRSRSIENLVNLLKQ